jgi:WD40 repeat protein
MLKILHILSGAAARRVSVVAVTFACVAAPLATPASAQYFGRNKVQYKKFDFKVLKTANFDIYFYPEEQKGADVAAKLSERWRARLGQILGHELSGRQPLILYASHPDFEQTNAISGELGEGTGGVTEPLRRRMVLPFGGPLADTDHVIGHELVHAFQFDIAAESRRAEGGGGGMTSGIERLPLWFIEGMAEYLSIGPVDPNTSMWMRDAIRKEELPTIKQLDNPKYFPYRWGQAFWAYVAGRWGDEIVGELLRDAISAGDPVDVIEARTGVKVDQLSKDWHAALRQAYEPIMRETQLPSTYGPKLTGAQKLGGELNVSPALTPDGKKMAFLSERDLFSIDIYVADTATGKVIDRVSKTAVDPHYSSLQFISSAGAWDSSGQRLAFAAVVKGRPALAIWNLDRKRVEQEAVVNEVDEIYNPTWSPDGKQIAFSGLSQGLTDLYVYDLAAGKVRRLTDDPFADIQPAWSPDGRRIAFATDRFSSDLATLDIGNYRIGFIDPVSGTIQPGPFIERSKNINPQWSADGRTLFFLSDFNGRTNIFRADADGGSIRQITNLLTGVSGITATSPALSAAQKTNQIAFSVFEDNGYQIYASGNETALAGTDVMPADRITSAMLPPQDRKSNAVTALINNAQIGLGGASTPDVQPYHASLGLEFVGQPSVGVGSDRFGTYASGGMALYFSDLLGDHTLATAVQINQGLGSTGIRDIGAAAQYVNLKRRWNWGIEGDQTPYVSGAFQSFATTIDGEPAGVEQTIIFRQTSRGLGGLVAYPFSRAHRVEFSGGYRSVSFEQQEEIFAYSLRTGQVLRDDRTTTSLGETLRFAQTSAALVYDTSVFGATSPVLGQRYRLEVAPTIGTISFSDVLADYRRYVMPIPFYTIAGRIMHYGRYGPDGEDPRLTPLFIGYPTLVRGYDVGSFSATECFATPTSTCPAFDRLVGSRIAVANLEFRFPLLRPFGLRRNVYGPLPIEAALFADAGIAWDKSIGPFDDYRKAVSSVGGALRINAFGFAVIQLDLARPLQRPGQGWKFQFSLAPGW